ncbi:uncharacterized protein AKAW2_51894S [Aspergillus luchuensis]|uniref:HAUS augmin-like complex subunit 1 n=3 Tax=Aspergillus subgen. Circumdati TaxID=2720871 RepID=A0A8G1QWV5_9EURO|nr:hypothetical protein BO85DRAFT_489879 [Aspergillus piperis CBS 112811]XP_041545315.1 uncharacterized protein AKAW2_51894S [Aspergillus luchuensis]OJZ81231.1 hypothetical protein ASPFODRAFT_52280 [Aspergillus luchuensis CBS 106.47]GAA87979.1 similar to An06g01620 [Aspergillus luchuensis IFO 4308]RAH55886.1 hypothetical protein BO85DRAFT_489879 [Aspergillus piperis CBS 112811]BCS01553.1 hypothetical protein AKAW2_51894S [Aspergillus luchuensis]BCS13269.1 hypothetical protein ALUC_51315S [Asp
MDSPLLSPAKARQAAIQAKDWAYVNAWLSRQYAPNPVPSFERNEDTLRTLLALAAANDTADEEATVLHQAREQAVESFKAREKNEEKQKVEILDEVEHNLDDNGRRNLDDLAETTAVLGALGTSTRDLGQSIIELTVEEFDAQQQMSRVQALHEYLGRELATLREQLLDLKTNEVYETPANLPALTAEWTRETKLLSAKAGEYHDRIASLQRNRIKGPTLEEVIAEEQSVIRMLESTETLVERVKKLHDLPSDIPGARAQYKELEQELDLLTQQRNTMSDKLADK